MINDVDIRGVNNTPYVLQSDLDDVETIANGALQRSGGTMNGEITMGSNNVDFNGSYIKQNGVNRLGLFADNRVEILNQTGNEYQQIHAAGFYTYNGSTQRGRFSSNGNHMAIFAQDGNLDMLTSTGSSYGTINAANFNKASSERYKDIIGKLDIDRAKLLLNVDSVKYTYKKKFNDDGGKEHYGLIAERLDEIGLKDLVSYDEDDKPCGIDYSKLTPYLLVLIKDLYDKINKQ